MRFMEIEFPPDVEERLSLLASESGRGKAQLVIEIVSNQLGYEAWFHQEVQKGLGCLRENEPSADLLTCHPAKRC
jgi:predicted transcriptional regulator